MESVWGRVVDDFLGTIWDMLKLFFVTAFWDPCAGKKFQSRVGVYFIRCPCKAISQVVFHWRLHWRCKCLILYWPYLRVSIRIGHDSEENKRHEWSNKKHLAVWKFEWGKQKRNESKCIHITKETYSSFSPALWEICWEIIWAKVFMPIEKSN